MLFLFVTAFFSCDKKYTTEKNYMEPVNDLCTGVWYLQKYEVDGVDSTSVYAEKRINEEGFRMSFVKKENKKSPTPVLWGRDYKCYFSYKREGNWIQFGNNSYTCNEPGLNSSCVRNIFKLHCGEIGWDIVSLNKNEVVFCCKNNHYINSDITKIYIVTLGRQNYL
jgi:hypothetical protein